MHIIWRLELDIIKIKHSLSILGLLYVVKPFYMATN
jgi:hypothetical protein